DGCQSPSPRLAESPPVSPLTLPRGDCSFPNTQRLDPIVEHEVADHVRPQLHERTASLTSISFKGPSRAEPKIKGKSRSSSLRGASPPPPSSFRVLFLRECTSAVLKMVLTEVPSDSRFQHHVSFDNFAAAEPTVNNTISFTLNVKHTGYQFKRRSRTFMVGIDENDYSNIALQWMLEELVDDGDEIVCLRVVDKGSKIISNSNLEVKKYQEEAKETMNRIQKKNDDNRAISIVLEFAVGKLSSTFLQMIQIYEPAMLIVGTRGRSLGGVQGLVSQRNSFSKWCLQYSPIPVVVVRPTEKRIKKKNKRVADPTRQDYARILRESGIEEHETNVGASHIDFETSNSPDGEAHAVAAALGLPAAFDPTLKPINLPGSHPLKKVDSGNSEVTSVSKSSISPDSRPNSPHAVRKRAKSQIDSPGGSGDESSDDDEEGEFEVTPGLALLQDDDGPRPEIQKKMKLHEMEVGEAQALQGGRKTSIGSVDSLASGRGRVPDNEDEDEG
ncbi:Universal stress protein A family protein, partial [Lachnellula occidentalis]